MNTKTDKLIEVINSDIRNHERRAQQAMQKLEDMKISTEEYKKAVHTFDTNNFIAGYLRHIMDFVKKSDIRSAENLIRFHAHYQREKGNLNDGQSVSVAQAAVAVILEGYVKNHFSTAA